MRGIAPDCLKALQNFNPEHAEYYLDEYYASALIPVLSKRFGVPEDRIFESYGAEGFLRTVFDSLNPSTDSVLTHQYHYGYYKTYLENRGIVLNVFRTNVNTDAFVYGIEDCVEQYKKYRPKIVLLTSPNNPTGNVISAQDLKRVLDVVNEESLVILDEAYWGFNSDYDEASFIALLEQFPNLIILRSFSKYYGLAGLRIGFALCGEGVKKILNYQRFYLGMSRVLEEVAIAALNSTDYYVKVAQEVMNERTRMIDEISRLKHFKAFDSKANFICIETDVNVIEKLEKALEALPVLTIKRSYENYWRVTIDLPENNSALLSTLKDIDAS
jgi:histidinol-phosphate aminotransferase